MEAYTSYRRSSCLLECRAREMQRQCGCLPYYYPRFSRIWKESITCDFEGLLCLSNLTSEGSFAIK